MKKFLLLSCLVGCLPLFAQTQPTDSVPEPEGYRFTEVKKLKTGPVQNQGSSGTCWSFSMLSFLADDFVRDGKPEVHLSEMFVVRYAYLEKAIKCVRMHGAMPLAEGGAAYDVLYIIRKYGIVPNEVYDGLNYGSDTHRHGELSKILKSYTDVIISNPNKKLSTAWLDGLNGILDAYLGKVPETFVYQGKSFTPQSFAEYLGFDIDNYVSVTSFTHHPFYEKFALELPDNWLWSDSYNVPLDDMKRCVYHALDNDRPVMWASDVSEKGFQWKKGIAVVPKEKVKEDMSDTELARWVKLSAKDREEEQYKLEAPGEEMAITQELRQTAFDDYSTTDDHGMEIVGTATDQIGHPYFIVKNSWDTNAVYDGFFYASEPYFLYKTTSILVNKKALPKDIRKKLSIK